MKKSILLGSLTLLLVACAGENTEETTETIPQEENVLPEDQVKELEEAQSINVELEQLDGELDSLLNTI